MNIRDRIIELRRVPASELIPNPKNWRTHPEAQKNALRGVLAEVGIADAVLARETPAGLMLIDGHLRAETAAGAILPVLVLDVTDAEADKILATLDPLAAMAESDPEKLAALLENMETESAELQAMLDELAADAGIEEGEPEIIEDETPEPPVVAITQPGDLWTLGDHRVLCGDSTNAEHVARLMGGAKADLCFTSPPYGVAGTSKLRDHYVKGAAKREKFYDNHKDDAESWPALMAGWFDAFRPFCECVICNVQMLADNKRAMVLWVADRVDDLCDVVIWEKPNPPPQMQANVLSNAYEFCFIFGGNATRAIPFASFHGNITNVFRLGTTGKNEFTEVHRATFPIELPTWFIQTLCSEAKSVVDPFCGSGTTLIAAEQLKRKCYGMEISPQYCDVIVKRWETLTGKKATREPAA